MDDNSTSTSLFIIDKLYKAISEVQSNMFQAFWNFLMNFFSKNWVFLLWVLFIIFVVALIRAILGRWGMLGSVLYNYIYFGILFILGLVFSPSIFNNIFFDLVCFILYIVCYRIVGLILDYFGLHKKRL